MSYPAGGFKTSRLDHLGLVAATFDQLKIGATLDNAIDQDTDKRNVSIGNIVKAMVLNGLGFVNQTLYLCQHKAEMSPVAFYHYIKISIICTMAGDIHSGAFKVSLAHVSSLSRDRLAVSPR